MNSAIQKEPLKEAENLNGRVSNAFLKKRRPLIVEKNVNRSVLWLNGQFDSMGTVVVVDADVVASTIATKFGTDVVANKIALARASEFPE